ncbi:MAG: SRPBCC family protein [Alphaproteobacteria bacterium]
MAQLTRSVTLNAAPGDVWALIGGFQSLPDWHPAVETSTREDIGGVEHRRLGLAGGGELLEKNLGSDTMSIGYEIIESPLPVADYKATISVADAGGKAVVVWASTYEGTADGADDIIAGIYQAGLDALAAKFGT